MITVIKTLIKDAKAYIAIHFFKSKSGIGQHRNFMSLVASTHFVFLDFISKA